MSFATPLGLLGLLAVPLVVVFHLFRRHLQERRIAALFLFAPDRLTTTAGRTRTTLLRTPSFWCEVLAATVFGLLLAQPSFVERPSRHVVVVVDDSASLGVPAARQAALARVDELVDELASGDRITLLRTGVRPQPLVGPAALPAEARAALAAWQPVAPRHDPAPALDLARELAAGSGEVHFVTDQRWQGLGEDFTVHGVGTPGANAAILSALRIPRAEGDELRLAVQAFGHLESVTLTVRAGAAELARQALAFTDGRAECSVRLPAGCGDIEARLAGDALAIDDAVWLVKPSERIVAIADLLSKELQAALELPRVLAAIPGHRAEAEANRAQLVLADRPGQLRAGQVEVVVAPGNGERQAWAGPFAVDRTHPWLAGVQLQGVVWLAGVRSLPGQVLVAVGNQPLLSEEFLDQGRRLWINLDASAGNAVRAPDWPLLFANLVDGCRSEVPGAEQSLVMLGEEVRYRRSLLADGGDRTLWLVDDAERRQPGRGDRTVGWLPERPGLYRVVDADGGERARLGVRFFDPVESDLRGAATFRQPATATTDPGAAGATRDRGFEARLLLCLLLGLLAFDWWWLGRSS